MPLTPVVSTEVQLEPRGGEASAARGVPQPPVPVAGPSELREVTDEALQDFADRFPDAPRTAVIADPDRGPAQPLSPRRQTGLVHS